MAGILAMYILSLPLALIFHAQTHTQTHTNIVHSDFDNITIDDDVDCQICSFYFDQQLYVQSSFAFQLEVDTYHFHQNITQSLFAVSQEQQYLRGPPVV